LTQPFPIPFRTKLPKPPVTGSVPDGLFSISEPYTTTTTATLFMYDACIDFSTGVQLVYQPISASESVRNEIDKIPDSAEFYEDGEPAPDAATKDTAKNLLQLVTPPSLLAGADVYAYYGEVNVVWESARKKIKLIVPPHTSGKPVTLYEAVMENGKVEKHKLDENVTVELLQQSLFWIHG
jgi:hypothetical protein